MVKTPHQLILLILTRANNIVISDLTKQMEWIEMEEMKSNHYHVSDDLKRMLGYEIIEIDNVLCSVCRTDPNILLNRAIGLGISKEASREQINAIVDVYKTMKRDAWFLHVIPEIVKDDLMDWMTTSGLHKNRGWMKFLHNGQHQTVKSSEFTIQQINASQVSDFAKISSPCFDLLDSSRPLIETIVRNPEYYLFMSYSSGKPAGTGAVYIKNNIAYVDWGATHRDFRQRGSQSALLAHRINFAIEMGCQTIVTATGEAVEGDPQHSYHNIMRYGFNEFKVRQNWVPGSMA